jgi:hypothetical protein
MGRHSTESLNNENMPPNKGNRPPAHIIVRSRIYTKSGDRRDCEDDSIGRNVHHKRGKSSNSHGANSTNKKMKTSRPTEARENFNQPASDEETASTIFADKSSAASVASTYSQTTYEAASDEETVLSDSTLSQIADVEQKQKHPWAGVEWIASSVTKSCFTRYHLRFLFGV